MQTWLKLIGSNKEPITEHPFYGKYDETQVGFRKNKRPSIHSGDQIFLYAPGGSMSIFTLAEVISDPEINPQYNPEEEGSCYWNINVRYLINLPVSSGIHLNEITTEQRDLSKSIQQQSHIRLLPEELDLAYSKLNKKAAN